MEDLPNDLYDMPMEGEDYYPAYDGEFEEDMDVMYENYEGYPGYYEDFAGHGDIPYHEYDRIPFTDLITSCIPSTVEQMGHVILPLLLLCFVHKISARVITYDNWIHQIGSIMLGTIALHRFFKQNILYLILLVALTYVLLLVTSKKCKHWNGVAVSVVCLVYILTCELAVVPETDWHQIRGAQMILTMKMISLAFDLDSGAVTELPSLFQFTAYTAHAGTVIFGPWVSYNDFVNAQNSQVFFGRSWFFRVVKCATMTLICVSYSTCITSWLIYDNAWRWLVAYRDAQSFRFSHYFVCFLSELTCLMSGVETSEDSKGNKYDIEVSHPTLIEVPRSLVEVVTNWNLPMHNWLKIYVFKTARPLGTFIAVLLTYAASSLLHGLNFQLAAVLFSLGFYSYVEYMFRNRLSKIFNACIQAKKCRPDCGHQFQADHYLTAIVNIIFGFLSIFHLAYLGLMFDSSGEEEKGYTMFHTLSKWAHLSFASHWVALATYVLYWLI